MADNSIPIKFQLDTSSLEATAQAMRSFSTQIRQEFESLTQLKQVGAQIDQVKSKTSDWQKVTQTLGTTFNQSLRGMLQGTTTFSKGWQSAITGMATQFEQSLASMLLKWTEHHAMRSLVHAAANQADVASDRVADAQKKELSLSDTLRQVTHAAIKAAANAYNAVVGIPIVGPVLAPPAAAVAFAGVEAFGALASAAGGWEIVPQDQLALVHKNEMVLPAALADRVRDMTSGSSGSEIHIHTGGNSFAATDAAGMERLMRQHEKAIVRTIQRLHRNGALRLSY